MVQFEEDNPDDLLGNMVVLGISLIVIAAVVIGVVAGIDRPGDSNSDKMTQTESLDSVCGQTDYKQTCTASLQPAGMKAAVISYFRVAVNATLTAMAHAMKMVKADADAVSLDHESEKMALEDCIELIGLCMEELQSVITIFINSTTSTSFHYDSGDIRSSLSAVLSYQIACIEGLKESRSTSDNVDQILQKPTELTSNALAIIYEYSENDDAAADPQAAAAAMPPPPPPATSNDPIGPVGRQLLESGGGQMKPDAVVAKDKSGQYASIAAALNAYPNGHKGRYLIYVKSGVYEENVIIAKNTTQIFMYGDGLDKTIISGRDHFRGHGTTTYRRATLSVIGDGFICKDIGIKVPEKSRGKSMAAAVKMQSDRAAFFNCRINGSATSNIYALANRQLLVGCEIYGVTNIIRGDGAVVIQRSKIILTPPSSSSENNNNYNIIIALQGRSDRWESSGFVIQACTIRRDESYIYSPRSGVVVGKGGAYLGMAVANYSRTIVMESSLGDLIHPDGWYWDNNKKYAIENVTFAEYENMGPGSAATNSNINRSIHVISNSSDAMRYTAGRFIQAQNWFNGTLVPPFKPGLVFHNKR